MTVETRVIPTHLEAAMQSVRTLRYLTLSTVIALGSALTLACGGEPATAPDEQSPFVVNAAGTPTYVDDDGKYYCKSNYSLVYGGNNPYSAYDLNHNEYLCAYNKGNSTGRPYYVDDVNLTCKSGYGLLQSGGLYGDIWDFNNNDHICGLIPKN
jgi:hypothetical protein